MIWTLNKAIAVTTVKIFVSTVFGTDDAETTKRYRTTLNRLSRIMKQVQASQMMHPSLLLSEYGSMIDYLRVHLSTDDYRFVNSLQPVMAPACANRQPIAKLV